MDQRRWEDLDKDCLMNVFVRVGMESLLLDIPFVCKSWHATSLDPSCWQSLIFPHIHRLFLCVCEDWKFDSFLKRFVHEYGINERSCFSVTAFIKFVVNRSGRHAKTVDLPENCTVAALTHVADVCPGLKTLSLPSSLLLVESSIVPQLIGNWKDMESLSLGSSNELVKILTQISIHCSKLSHLNVTDALIGNDEVSAMVNFAPRIKHLILSCAHIPRQCLVELLQGCKELLTLDASGCTGFTIDNEILKLTSHIPTFSCEGSFDFDIEETYIHESDESYYYEDDGYHSDFFDRSIQAIPSMNNS